MNTSQPISTRPALMIAAGLAAGLLATSVGPADRAQAEAGQRPTVTVQTTKYFSPNGDGVKDRAVIRYTLSRASKNVVIKLTYQGASNTDVRKVVLGPQTAGEHGWTWNGRRGNGDAATDASYLARVTAHFSSGPATARQRIVLDTRFVAAVGVDGSAVPATAKNVVYPRSTALVDALPLTAVADAHVASARVAIRDDQGRVVLRRDFKGAERGRNGTFLHLDWRARQDGEPLSPGKYRGLVTGIDKAGNRGRSKVYELVVSPRRLVWREETLQLTASESDVSGSACGWIFTGNDCPLSFYCGTVVASERFPGGLSHRSAVCPEGAQHAISKATSVHLVPVPEATVRGVDRARVAFEGGPTHDGETDAGTLVFGRTTTSESSGSSGWVKAPPFGIGRDPINVEGPIPPSVLWTFETAGDAAFEVATWTIDYRYAVVQ